jgi:hypothetical protein
MGLMVFVLSLLALNVRGLQNRTDEWVDLRHISYDIGNYLRLSKARRPVHKVRRKKVAKAQAV